jgi:hypothetical protein
MIFAYVNYFKNKTYQYVSQLGEIQGGYYASTRNYDGKSGVRYAGHELREIAQMMVEHDCGCVPIVENQSNKKPIGTITDRDITIRAFATGQNPAELKASDAMTMGVATITPDANIEKCADVMEDKKIRRVVVVNDDGKVVGMVAQADIAEHAPNPSLIGNVVNEISDAPASPNRGVFNRMRGNQSYSDPDRLQRNRHSRAIVPVLSEAAITNRILIARIARAKKKNRLLSASIHCCRC